MLHLTLAQIRAHTGRLVASSTAVVIAVAFVVATLTLGASSEASVLRAVAAEFTGSAVVVRADPAGEPLEPARAQALHAEAAARAGDLPQVAAVALDSAVYLPARVVGAEGSGTQLVRAESVAAPGPLRWQRLADGRLPERPGEVAVSGRTSAAPGDVLELEVPGPPSGGEPGTAPPAPPRARVTVVGVVDLGGDPSSGVQGRLVALPADVAAWQGEARAVRIAAAPGTSDEQLREAVAAVLPPGPLTALTGTEAAEEVAAGYTGESAGLSAVLLTFAAVAVLVAGLVIANTFAVLLAQRTRELALLRCVGAQVRQLRRGVLGEALGMGLVASALGVAAGVGLAALVSVVVARTDSPIPLGAVAVPLSALVVGPVLGVGVTVVASLLPTRAATRVSPLAALRPLDPAPLRSRGGLARLAVGLVLLVPSTAALVVLSWLGLLLPAVAAGALSFLGVLLLGQRAVPPLVGLAGRLLAPLGGVPGRLAAGNSLRNPRRTAATATALVVGVTLTTAMVVGAASTRATADGQLDAMYPADVVAESPAELPAAMAQRVLAVDGVHSAVVALRGTVPSGPAQGFTVYGVDPVAAAEVLRTPASSPRPQEGTAVLSRGAARDLAAAEGGALDLGGTRFRVRVDTETETPLVLAAADVRALDAAAVAGVLWVRVDDGLAPAAQAELVTDVEAAVWEVDPDAIVQGVVAERASLDSMLTTLLLVVTGLLGVAVLIALVGVGNTLALSVVERRQESGLLRALGLTRRQLRATLAWEALLVAGVAATLGVALGTGYGLAGTHSVFGLSGEVVLDVPWLRVGAIVVVATAAGVLASVLPARRAARTSPVAAIAG
ncbi:hypothetical protein NUM3379_12300 [Kineococcus sp. NUM-3379]